MLETKNKPRFSIISPERNAYAKDRLHGRERLKEVLKAYGYREDTTNDKK